MLQRIQTVFMFLAVVAGVLMFFFPIATYISDKSTIDFFIYVINDLAARGQADGMQSVLNFGEWFTLPLSIGQIVILILVFLTIFQYKKRILQIRINRLTIFLNVLLVGGMFYYTTMLEEATGAASDYGVAAVLPLLAIVLLFLANHYIRKDEKLIRSADRLR